MKRLTILILVACLQLSAKSYTQKITLLLKDAPLEQAFFLIQKQSPYRFIYTKEELEEAKRISIDVRKEEVETVLQLCFREQPLTYTIVEKFVVIKSRETGRVETGGDSLHAISGKVRSEAGALEGVSVQVKGSGLGTTTNSVGDFFIKDVPANAVLVFSYVGYEAQEIPVNNRQTLHVQLRLAVKSLDETIIRAYGTTTRRLNTGNISKISAEEISRQPVSNPLAALEGRVPGVQITQNTGVPGGAFTVRLRGQNSLRPDGNDPFYIIDGVPFISVSLSSIFTGNIIKTGNPLNLINPSSIESIEILKDADATAIYGSRGANGVILITTKKGKTGKPAIDLTAYTGIGRISKRMNLLNTQQFLAMRKEAYMNDGQTIPATSVDLRRWDTTRYTDWQKVLIGGTAHTSDLEINISSGNSVTRFLLGAGYHRETTVFPGNFSDQKASVLFNLTHAGSDQKFKVLFSAHYVVDKNNLLQQDLTPLALKLSPNAPAIYKADGSLNWENSTWINPFSNLLQKYKGTSNNLISNAILSYSLFSDLEVKTSFGYNNMSMTEVTTIPGRSFNPAFGISPGSGQFSNANIQSWNIEPQINWNKQLSKGKLNVLIGATFQENIRTGQVITANGFVNDFMLENIKAASSITNTDASYAQYRYNAFFGRVSYDWEQEYILNLTGRRDGSSRFGPNKQFGNFGALGAAWIFSKERFIQKRLSYLSFGKLRISYGITGSDQAMDYGYLDSWTSANLPYQNNPSLYPSSLFNPNFGWETNKKFESAIELGLFKERILISTSYYRNRSSNQLIGYALPLTTGFTSIQSNFPATVQNTGLEIEMKAGIIKTSSFRWTTSGGLTIPRNQLIEFPNIEGSSYSNTYMVGHPLYIRKVYNLLGVDPQTGVYLFRDVDGNGIISSPNDRQTIKEIAQSFFGGFENNFEYKGFQLDFFFQFIKQTGYNFMYFYAFPGIAQTNQPTYVLDRWQKPGDISGIQKFTRNVGSPAAIAYVNGQNYGENTIGDASFIRLKNFSISYRLPDRLKQKLHLGNCRIYILGQNIFTITHYRGLDPENQDLTTLPPLKVLTTGIQLTF